MLHNNPLSIIILELESIIYLGIKALASSASSQQRLANWAVSNPVNSEWIGSSFIPLYKKVFDPHDYKKWQNEGPSVFRTFLLSPAVISWVWLMFFADST